MSISKRAAYAALFFTPFILALSWYFKASSGPFFLDDEPNFYGLRFIDSIEKLIYYCLTGPAGQRWFAYLSFYLHKNAWLSGDAQPFKLVNITIHCLNAGLIFFTTRKLFAANNHSFKIALITSLIWFIHPIHANTVLYSVQRMTALAATLTLCGLLFSLYFPVKNNYRSWLIYTITLWGITVIGIGFKETAIMLPALAWLTTQYTKPHTYSKTQKLITYLFPYLALLTLLILQNRLNYAGRDFTLYERLLSQVVILKEYIQKIFLPNNASFSLFYDDFKPVHYFSEARFSIAIIFWFLLISAAIWLKRYSKWPLFGLLFFILGQVLESSIIPLELYFDHRNYLPSLGIIIGVVSLFDYLATHSHRMKALTIIASLLLAANLLYYLEKETGYWHNLDRLAESNFKKHPNSQRALQNYAEHLIATGKPYQSLQLLEIIHKRFGASISNIINQISIACLMDKNATFNNQNIEHGLFTLPNDSLVSTSLKTLQSIADDGTCSFVSQNLIQKYLKILLDNPHLSSHKHNLHFLLMQNLMKNKKMEEALESSLNIPKSQKTPQYILMQIHLAISTEHFDMAEKLLLELQDFDIITQKLYRRDIRQIRAYMDSIHEK